MLYNSQKPSIYAGLSHNTFYNTFVFKSVIFFKSVILFTNFVNCKIFTSVMFSLKSVKKCYKSVVNKICFTILFTN